MSGRRSKDHDERTHLATLEANLNHAVSRLSAENIIGLIEPLNPVSTPGYFLNSFETGKNSLHCNSKVFTFKPYEFYADIRFIVCSSGIFLLLFLEIRLN